MIIAKSLRSKAAMRVLPRDLREHCAADNERSFCATTHMTAKGRKRKSGYPFLNFRNRCKAVIPP